MLTNPTSLLNAYLQAAPIFLGAGGLAVLFIVLLHRLHHTPVDWPSTLNALITGWVIAITIMAVVWTLVPPV